MMLFVQMVLEAPILGYLNVVVQLNQVLALPLMLNLPPNLLSQPYLLLK
jgi:hypothetical protein